MQTRRLLLLAALALPVIACAQGSLTPPGTPSPSMKTLTQIEPRTPVEAGATGIGQNANGGFTLSAAGSYYLTRNLTVASGNGIVIAADNVTLDLNGFTIAGTGYSNLGDAVLIDGSRSNIAIRNGHIAGATTCDTSTHIFSPGGFLNGINGHYAFGTCTVSDLTVVGMAQAAVNLSLSSNLVRGCAVQVCGTNGITGGTISDCLAVTCGATAILGVTVQNCTGDASVGPGAGIEAYTAANCWGIAYSGAGIEANVATNCQGTSNSGTGVMAGRTAENCYGETATGTYGLAAIETATNCSGNNTTGKAGAFGLYTDGLASGCRGSTPVGTAGLKASVAQNCQGSSTSGIGLSADRTAENCYGTTTTGTHGLRAGNTASNCYGTATNGATGTYGLYVLGTASGCYGYTKTGIAGLLANEAANCEGVTTGGTHGLRAYQTATHCSGWNFGTTTGTYGLRAALVSNCYGENWNTNTGTYGTYADISANNSTGGGVVGLTATRAASYCHGVSTGSTSPIAISTGVANFCTTGGGAISATTKNFTP